MLGSGAGVAAVTKLTFHKKNGSLFCWFARAVSPQPCSGGPSGTMAHAAHQ